MSLFELSSGLCSSGEIEPIIISPEDGPLRPRYAAMGISVDVVQHPWAGSPESEEFQARLRRIGQAFLYAGADVVSRTGGVLLGRRGGAPREIPSVWIIRESLQWDRYYSDYPEHVRNLAYDAFAAPYRVVFVARSTLDAWKPLDSRHSFTLIRNGLNTTELIAAYRGLDRDRTEARALVAAPNQGIAYSSASAPWRPARDSTIWWLPTRGYRPTWPRARAS